MRFILAAYAAQLPNGRANAKNFPWWKEVVRRLNYEGHEVVQVAGKGEDRVQGVGQFIQGFPLDRLAKYAVDFDSWLSVDSFWPHFCATNNLPTGVVVWSQSNPRIWGYPHNTNLLKAESYLRSNQYEPWFDVPYNEDAFVSPEEVVEALYAHLTRP